MKYLNFIILFILISSCCSTKKVANSSKGLAKTNELKSSMKKIKNQDSIMLIEKEQQNTKKDTLKNETFNLKLTKRNFHIHELWNELLQKHVSKNGNVNYKGFKTEHQKLIDYWQILDVSLENETKLKAPALAFWINAYNAFTVDLILRNYPIKSIKDIKDPWKQRHWKLGNKWYNLDEIEHQILRNMNEPRIHFAINCASVSCPKLLNRAFTSNNLEEQLTKTTKEFINNSSNNYISENEIRLSKIFKWFAKDFKQNGSLVDFLNQYSEFKISEKAKKSFMEYNWDLNE